MATMTNFQLVTTFPSTPASYSPGQITHRCKYKDSYRTTFYKHRGNTPRDFSTLRAQEGQVFVNI